MVDSVRVDADGLRSASEFNDALAGDIITTDAVNGARDVRPTVAAVQAMSAAVADAHADQAGYLDSAAESLRSGAGSYERTDVGNAESIIGTM